MGVALLPGAAWADGKVAAPPASAAAPPAEGTPRALEVAGSVPEGDEVATVTPRRHRTDGAGPRLSFGRAWVAGADDGFYGRFESEYFEVASPFITGALVGVEGWGTEGASAGGGSLPLSFFVGLRGGPFEGPKAPLLFLTAGLGVLVVVYDRIDDTGGLGLLSPFAVATAGVELAPGFRLLADGRATERWHWTSESVSELQLGLTVCANSMLWDGE